MNCEKCNSLNLKMKPKGPHIKLFCGDCGAYQKFVKKDEVIKISKIILDQQRENV